MTAARAEAERQTAALAASQTVLREQKEAADKAADQHRRQMEQHLAKLREAEAERDRLKAESGTLAGKLQVRFDEITKLTRLLQAAEPASGAKAKELAEIRQIQKRQTAEHRSQVEALQKKLADEAAKAKREVEAARRAAFKQLGQAVISLLGYSPETPMSKDELRRLTATIKNIGLLDSRWYLQRYKDVADFGMDPAVHYLLFGVTEGRQPRDAFRTLHKEGEAV